MNKLSYHVKNEWIRQKMADYYVCIIVCYCILGFLQRFLESLPIHRVMGGIVFIMAMFMAFYKMRKEYYSVLFLIALIFIKSLFSTASIAVEISNWIFLFSTIFSIFLVSHASWILCLKNSLSKYNLFICYTTIIMSLFLGISFFIPSCYGYKWGEGSYFTGFCNSEHTLASLACLLYVFFYISIKNSTSKQNKRLLFCLSLIPIIAVFNTGARTFLIPIGILFFYTIPLICFSKKRRLAIYIICCIVGAIGFVNSSMLDKFLYVFNNKYVGDALESFTNGRNVFWLVDLKDYASGNFLEVLIGKNFANVYSVNYINLGVRIWAHNDLIFMLCGTGVVGTIIYLGLLLSLFNSKFLNFSFFKYCLFVIYVMFPLFFNGFFTYQYFVYSFIFLYIDERKLKGCGQNEHSYI